VHTDIIAHSVDAFPGRDGEETLAFFMAVKEGKVPELLGDPKNENARRFVMAPKPTPKGLEREEYFAVNTFRFVDKDGKGTNVRYRIVPELGVETLSDEETKSKPANFLYDGLKETIKSGPAVFKLVVQVAEEGDVTSDNTVKWPEERKLVELGRISLDKVVEDDEAGQAKKVIFDPIPRVDGVEASDDPLLDVRATAYLVSGRERRAA
jgi:catalase